MWTIVFTSVQISSRHQTLYRVLCLSQSPNGRAYFPPPSVIFSQDSIAWKLCLSQSLNRTRVWQLKNKKSPCRLHKTSTFFVNFFVFMDGILWYLVVWKELEMVLCIILLWRLNIEVFICLNFHLPRWSTLCYGPCLTDVHWTSSTINRCSTRYNSFFRLADENLFCVKFIDI